MYDDEYVYNGPSGARYRGGLGQAAWPGGDPYARPTQAATALGDTYATPARSSNLLSALSHLHAQQESIMAALLDAVPSPMHANPAAQWSPVQEPYNQMRPASSSSWPARPPQRAPSPHGMASSRLYHASFHDTTPDVFIDSDADPFLVRSPPQWQRPSQASQPRDEARAIYESLYGQPLAANEARRQRSSSRPRPVLKSSSRPRPVLKSCATVEYYQQALGVSQPLTAPAPQPASARDPPRDTERSTPAVSRVCAPSSTSSTTAPTAIGAIRSGAVVTSAATRPTRREAPKPRSQSRPQRKSRPASAHDGVAVQPDKSASWAQKLIESIETHTATRYHALSTGRKGPATTTAEDDEEEEDALHGGAPNSVAAITVQSLSNRAGTLRWRPLLTDLAACVHAYQHVCPACGVFRHYFIDSRPKALILFRIFCAVWRALLRFTQVQTRAATSSDDASTLVTRRYVDLREITMTLSVVLSGLVVPEVRVVVGGAYTTAVNRALPGSARISAAAAASASAQPPPPQFAHRYRRLHASEQREVQRLVLDWIEQSVRQARALKDAVLHHRLRAGANLLAFDREGFVDAHALAQATVEALDVLLPLYETQSDHASDGDDTNDDDVDGDVEDAFDTLNAIADAPAAAARPPPLPPQQAQRESSRHQAQPAAKETRRPRVVPLPIVETDRAAFCESRGEPVTPDVVHHWAGDKPDYGSTTSSREDVNLMDVAAQTSSSDDEGQQQPVMKQPFDLRFVRPWSGVPGSHGDAVSAPPPLAEQPPQQRASTPHSPDSLDAALTEDRENSRSVDPPPLNRASTPPPSAVKRREDHADVAAADDAMAPHSLARRLLEIDASDYLDDFAAEPAVAVGQNFPVPKAEEKPHVAPPAAPEPTAPAAQSAPLPPSTTTTTSKTAPPPAPKKVIPAAAAAAAPAITARATPSLPPKPPKSTSEPSIRVLGRSASNPTAPATTVTKTDTPTAAPASAAAAAPPVVPMVATITAQAQRPLTAIQRYRMRQALTSSEKVDTGAEGQAKADTAAEAPVATAAESQRTAGTAALLSDLRSRVQAAEGRRAVATAAVHK